MAVYYAPFAAIFLARLHLVELARSRTAYVVGVAWIAFLAAAGLGLTIKDAGLKSATVRGPGGALKATPWDAAVYTPAVSAVTSRTRPGEPILVVPLSTSIYVLSGRANPLEDLSLLPRTLPSAADERATIARLERARVRVAVVDYRAFPAYGHTSFGGSFDRILAGWIRRNFTVAKTIRTGPPAPRLFRVWVRRLPAAGQ